MHRALTPAIHMDKSLVGFFFLWKIWHTYHRYMNLPKKSFLLLQLAGFFQELGLTKLLADLTMRK